MKTLSLLSFALMVAGLFGLIVAQSLFSISPLVIGCQGVAVALMLWARITFGRRSFDATADPAAGGLVTSGPYRFMRHPIYTAVLLFAFAGALAHASLSATGLALLVLLGALTRMLIEERLLLARYPDYAAYAERTKRMLPYVF